MIFKKLIISLPAILFFSTNAFAISDDQITEVLKTANNAEIEAAKVAKSKASSTDVKNFAKMMISDHESNLKDEKKMAKSEKIKMTDSDASKSLNKDAKEKIKDLKSKSGAEFDKAYMQLQIDMHTQLLSDLDNKLIPDAKNSSLKSYLTETRQHVQEHLSKAQEVQATLQ